LRGISIKARLRFAALIAFLAILVAGGCGIYGMIQSDAGLVQSKTATSAGVYQQRADMMHDALRADVLYALKVRAEGGQGNAQEIKAETATHVANFRDLIERLRALPLDEDVRRSVEQSLPDIENYLTAATAIANKSLESQIAEQDMFNQFMRLFSILEHDLGQMGDLIEQRGNLAANAAEANNQALIRLSIVASILAAAVLLVTLSLTARSITQPLDQINTSITSIAEGDLSEGYLTPQAALKSRDEVGRLANALNMLRQKLILAEGMEEMAQTARLEQAEVVATISAGLNRLADGNLGGEIANPLPEKYEPLRLNYNRTLTRLSGSLSAVIDSAMKIRACAGSITATSDDLAHRTETAAAALEETSAALSELSSSVKSASQNVKEVEKIVQSAREQAEDSGEVVSGAVEAMTGIERSSEQISQIIGVIDDIAFQTNLLALNAGVEAARAGEAGRGFAVVASEVRALAQRSSEASKEIKVLIRSSSHYVSNGVDAVGRAGKALSDIVDRVGTIASLMAGITTGATVQATSLTEVNSALTQLGETAQQNAAMVGKSLGTSDTLRQEAVLLDGVVKQFQLSKAKVSPAALRDAA